MSQSSKSAKDIFLMALDVAPSGRTALLDVECGGEAALRRQVEALLKVHDEPDSLLDSPRIDVGISAPQNCATIDQPPSERPGTQIGPYKLLQQIGEGGMGVVYMAEQTEPVKRRVALKIIKPGMDTRQVIARFEAERQALAMMDHQNIAKVFEAGTTDSGRPYFVMELVKGIPITRYCDDKHLSLKERLELMIPVCQAIQHAHQKGIIHRDIKPTNVLVAQYDGRPVPKVIDFGVAKATAQKLTERTMFTELGQIVGTVEYMSPEQAELNQLDIDTRSDIYSLGVLLYELLTGTTPFDRQRLRSAAFHEMLRIIREDEPPKPSTSLSTSGTLPTIASNRQTDPSKLSNAVRGELDWIVMKALEKDRNRRYETANALVADVQRYLNDEAVLACPPSARYRFGKFARRNKASLTTASLVAAALVAGACVSTWQMVRAMQAETEAKANEARVIGEQSKTLAEQLKAVAAAKAERVQRQLTASNLRKALDALDETYLRLAERLPEKAELSPADRRLLERILAFYEDFASQNAADPNMQYERVRVFGQIGKVYEELGQRPQAEAALRRALALGRELARQPESLPADALRNRRCLTNCQDRLGFFLIGDPAQHAAAEALLFEAAESLQQRIAEQTKFDPVLSADLALNFFYLGRLMEETNREEDAQSAYARAVQLFRNAATDPATKFEAQTNLAEVLHRQALEWMEPKPADAERCLKEAVNLRTAALKRSPRNLAYQAKLARSLHELDNAQQRLEEPEQAEKTFEQAATALAAVSAELPGVIEHRFELARALLSVGSIQANDGRPAQAEPAFRRAGELLQKLHDEFPDHSQYLEVLALSHFNLGNVLAWIDRRSEAEQEWQRSVELARKCVEQFDGLGRDTLASSLGNLGTHLNKLGRKEEAEKCYSEAVSAGRELVARYSDYAHYKYVLSTSLANLAEVRCDLGKPAEAIKLLDEAIGFQAEAYRGMPWQAACRKSLVNQYLTLAEWLADTRDLTLRDPPRASELARKALQLDPAAADAHLVLGLANFRAGDAEDAVAEITQGLKLNPVVNLNTVTNWFTLAKAHSQLGDKTRAREWYDRAAGWMRDNPEQWEGLRRAQAEAAELLRIELKQE